MPKTDAQFIDGTVPVKSGGTGINDSGPTGAVLTSDGVKFYMADATSNPFLSATAIFIDPVNGNDTNTGLQATPNAPATALINPGPLKTWNELRRRIGSNKLGNATLAQTITLLNDLAATDPMQLDFGCTGTTTIIGTPTVNKATSTIGAYTARVPSTNTPNQLTDGATVWGPFIASGLMFAITGGTGNGTFAYPVLDQGAGVARASSFLTPVGAETQPLAGSTYQVQRMTSAGSNNANITPTSGSWIFQFIQFPNLVNVLTGSLSVTFQVCALNTTNPMIGSNLTFTNCQSPFALQLSNSIATFTGGAFVATKLQLIDTQASLQGGLFFQGGNAGVLLQQRSWANFVNMCVFDWTFKAINFNSRSGGLLQSPYGSSAVASAVPANIDNTCQVDMSVANNRFIIASNPAAAVTIGTAATLAAWPVAVASRTVDPNSDATLVHF